MWTQCLAVIIIILLASFGGDNASAFYNKLTLMANVSMTLPYLFLAFAFPFFKAKKGLNREFVIYKKKWQTYLGTVVVLIVVGFANVFTIINPSLSGDYSSTIWMIAGPVIFALVAYILYESYVSRIKKDR